MADTSAKTRARLSALNTSLDDLESLLEPLLAQPLPETLVGLETMQQAKLQVAIPYLIYDLIFIYLKTRGIDPKTHPVIQELDRIRQYFDKLKKAEDTERRRLALDKAAANRFIKSAISSIQFTSQRPPGQDEGMPEAGGSTAKIPIRVTSKMIARAEYEKELKEADSEEEDDLEVFNGEEDDNDMVVDDEQEKEDVTSDQGKGKGRALDPDSEGTRKRRRVAMDPFDGYGDEVPPSPRSGPLAATLISSGAGHMDSGRSTPMSGSDAPTVSKKSKKKKKKNRKGSKGSASQSPLED